MDTRSVYVQQPFKVTFTVLTATWYTAPLDFENFQIPNAFIIPFDQTRPGMFTVNGKQYAGLTFYYIVFPYKSGRFRLPPIKIVATTPPEGSSESKKITIATPAQEYIVKPIPADFKGDWLVAKNVVISQHWNKPLQDLKVGDIIERRIIENASGTLPQFIPELETDSLDWSSIYRQDPELRDTRDDYDANGVRTENFTYLLEKEGDYEIPSAIVSWWNPYSHKVFQRSTGPTKIHVGSNPNLGILTSIKDSLQAKQPAAGQPKIKNGPYEILGTAWYLFLVYALAALTALYFLLKLSMRAYRFFHKRHIAYLQSERHWFRRFEHSSLQLPELLRNLYKWWDRFTVAGKEASIMNDALKNGGDPVANQLSSLYEQAYKSSQKAKADSSFKKNVEQFRAKAFDQVREDENISTRQQAW